MSTRIKSNIISLIIIQASNSLYPLIIIPILYKILSPDEFADFVFIEALVFYIIVFTLYGFDVTSIKVISLLRKSGEQFKIKYEFYRVTYTRLLLLLVSSLVVGIGVIIFSSELLYIYLFLLLWPLGVIFESAYYYIANEENLKLAIPILASRMLVCLFFILYLDNDYELSTIGFIYGLSFIISGLLSLAIISFRFGFSKPRFRNIVQAVTYNWPVFISLFSSLLYRNSNVIILTFVSSPAQVGLYAVIEKFIRMSQAVIRPLNQYFMPKLSIYINSFREKELLLTMITTKSKLQIILSIIIMLAVNAFSIIDYLLFKLIFMSGTHVVVFAVMSAAIVLGTLNFIYGVVSLTMLDHASTLAKFVIFVGIASIVSSIYLGNLLGAIGSATVYVFSELLLLILCVNSLLKMQRSQSDVG